MRIGGRRTLAGLAAVLVLGVACGGDDAQTPAREAGAPTAEAGDDAGAATEGTGTGVRGVITDRSTGMPVAGASIAAAAAVGEMTTERSAVTDAGGHYVHPLEPGEWDLTVSADGYRTTSRRITVTGSGPTVVDLALEPA